MKRLLLASFMSLLAVGHAYADWDAEGEAREQREREAEARDQAARDAAAQKLKRDAEAKAHAGIMAEKRKYVGAAAEGKSDAEVDRLYDEKQARTAQEGYAAMAEGQRKLNTPQGKAATKEVTGHTIEEMSHMSDAELEALSKEMEKKYGGGD